MSVNTLLSTVILVSFIVTIVLAIGSYMAYKLRERRRPTLAVLVGHVAAHRQYDRDDERDQDDR